MPKEPSCSSFRPSCQAVSEEVLEMTPPCSHLTATARDTPSDRCPTTPCQPQICEQIQRKRNQLANPC